MQEKVVDIIACRRREEETAGPVNVCSSAAVGGSGEALAGQTRASSLAVAELSRLDVVWRGGDRHAHHPSAATKRARAIAGGEVGMCL